MRFATLLMLAGCLDPGTTTCADGWSCPAGTRCATSGDVHCVSLSCGNGVLDSGEQCDGDVVDAQCVDLGHDEGVVRCDANCSYDARACRAFGFTTVFSGTKRIGAFCAYDSAAGVTAHFEQPDAIVRVAEVTSKLPKPPAPALAIECTADQLAVQTANRALYAYWNGSWVGASALIARTAS